jgi:hypothetical protein
MDHRINVVFTFLAFTWLISDVLVSYQQLHGLGVPEYLYPISLFLFFYWLFTGIVFQSTAWMIGSNGPVLIIPLIATSIYWRILAVRIVRKYDQKRQRNSNAATQASAMEKAVSPNPFTKKIGTFLFILFLLILILVLTRSVLN